jgi:hypothetical protein
MILMRRCAIACGGAGRKSSARQVPQTNPGCPSLVAKLGPQEASTGNLRLDSDLLGIRPIQLARRHVGRGQTILHTMLCRNSVVQITNRRRSRKHDVRRNASCRPRVGDQRRPSSGWSARSNSEPRPPTRASTPTTARAKITVHSSSRGAATAAGSEPRSRWDRSRKHESGKARRRSFRVTTPLCKRTPSRFRPFVLS